MCGEAVNALPTYDIPTKDVIDLGYAKHEPTWVNKTSTGTELLNYNNIRYAEPPTGPRRFRKPVVPPPHQDAIEDGNRSSWETDCLSSAPLGVPFPLLNGSTWGSEDCLFLNVIKPRGTKPGDKLPVLHWVVGSAFAFGGKDWTGFGLNTYGLWNRPLNLPDQFIIVTHNYRLGIAGWTPNLDKDMDGNIGVWDSLAAIEWTKKHISKFGGDPDNITAIGQSAGAAILTFLLLGRGGTLKLPFQQAWITSPTLPPRGNLERSRPLFNQILNFTGCSDIECMRGVSEDTFRRANINLLVESIPGAGGGSLGPGVGFTPIVDGDLIDELPIDAFTAGKFNREIERIVVGNTALEGLGLSSESGMPQRFPEIVRANIPNLSNETIASLQSLYPFPPDLPQLLAWEYTTDICWTCVVTTIASAYRETARRFTFSIPPATHGLDLFYLFYANNVTTPVMNVDVAFAAQHLLLEFMFRKEFPIPQNFPFLQPLRAWPTYGQNDTIANVTLHGFEIGPVPDITTERCNVINGLIKNPVNGV